jgi:hypothetical protein
MFQEVSLQQRQVFLFDRREVEIGFQSWIICRIGLPGTSLWPPVLVYCGSWRRVQWVASRFRTTRRFEVSFKGNVSVHLSPYKQNENARQFPSRAKQNSSPQPQGTLATRTFLPPRHSGNGRCFLFHCTGNGFSVTKTEQTLTGACPLGATGGVRLDLGGRNCTAATAAAVELTREDLRQSGDPSLPFAPPLALPTRPTR